MIKPDQERYSAGYMDERICPVDPSQYQGVLKKEVLNLELPENTETLLDLDELQGMVAGYIDSAFTESHSGKCASKLICLSRICQNLRASWID